MPKIVGKRGKAINASNNFQAFKLLFRIFLRFQGVKDSPAIPGPSCSIRGIRRKPTKISHPIPFRHLKRFWFWRIPPKAREVLVTFPVDAQSMMKSLVEFLGAAKELHAYFFIAGCLSNGFDGFGWPKHKRLDPCSHILGQKFPTENLQSKVACRCW